MAAASEVAPALAGGAQILDVKDPLRGSLGVADPEVVRAARQAAPAAVPVTAALGDGPWDAPARTARSGARLTRAGAELLKVGLAGLRPGDVRLRLHALQRTLTAELGAAVGLVAVGFADDSTCDPLASEWLAEAAAAAGLSGVMLDTLGKGRSLLRLRDVQEVCEWCAAARARDLLCGVAGSLEIADLPGLADVPDVVGLRGAVCEGGRGGRLSAPRVALARAALAGPAPSQGAAGCAGATGTWS